MAHFQNVIDDFNENIGKIAEIWQKQQNNFTDHKIEALCTETLQPLSDAASKINLQADIIKEIIKKLEIYDLITYY